MRRWIIAIVLLVLLAGGVLQFFRHAPVPATFTLSDGRVVTVAKITTGPVHRFRYDNRWEDYLGYFLPRSFRTNLHSRVREYTSTNADELVVWTTSSQRNLSSDFQVVVTDQNGIEVPVARDMNRILGGLVLAPTRTVSSNIVERWRIAPLPTHARDITLGFYNLAYDKNGMNFRTNRPMAQIRIRNPAYRLVGALTPEILPQVKTDGDVQITLLRVDARTNSQDFAHGVDWTIKASLTRQGESLTNWQFNKLEVFDAAGRLLLTRLWSRDSDSESEDRFDGLWPDTAWKLRLWAAPLAVGEITRHADFIVQPTWSGKSGATNSPGK